jgi:hypothetical protein
MAVPSCQGLTIVSTLTRIGVREDMMDLLWQTETRDVGAQFNVRAYRPGQRQLR